MLLIYILGKEVRRTMKRFMFVKLDTLLIVQVLCYKQEEKTNLRLTASFI